MSDRTQSFVDALTRWETLALQFSDVSEAYRIAHANAFNAQEKGTDTARKAAADAATSEFRMRRTKAEIAERTAYHFMIFLRGSAGEVERS